MARRTPKPRDTKERLLASAVEVIGTKGYGSTCIDDIVEHAGNTRGAFYYYFASKADIARDAQETLWSAAGDRAAQLVDPEADFLTKARRGLEAYLATLKDLGSERAFMGQGFQDPTLALFDGDGKKWGRHFIKNLLLEAMDKGEIPPQDAEEPTSLLLEALQDLTITALQGGDVTDAIRAIDEINQSLVRSRPSDAGDDRAARAPGASSLA